MTPHQGSVKRAEMPSRTALGLLRPVPSVELLLHAALDEPGAARAAWEAWGARIPSGRPGAAARRLLPLVWWNLGGADGRDAAANDLGTAYLESWARFQELVSWAAETVTALRAAGVQALVLKGLSLAVLHYDRPGLRPMADVDLLVAPRERATAEEVLQGLGYSPLRHPPPSALPLMHSLGHQRPAGGSLDLHWFSLLECCYPGADDDLWANAVPCPLAGVEGLAPDPAAMLLTVCAHGVRWSTEPHANWVADAMTLVRRHGASMRWDRLADEAVKRRMALRLAAALDYLATEFGADIPEATLSALRAKASARSERLELRLRQRPPGLLAGALLHWSVHRRRVGAGAEPPGIAAFVRYLQAAWGLASPAGVPAAVAMRTGSRLRPRRDGGRVR